MELLIVVLNARGQLYVDWAWTELNYNGLKHTLTQHNVYCHNFFLILILS